MKGLQKSLAKLSTRSDCSRLAEKGTFYKL